VFSGGQLNKLFIAGFVTKGKFAITRANQ